MTPDTATPPRVLIADDDPTMCGFCARALTGAGYTTSTVMNADSALAALREHGPFDLLLADIQMPGLSGLELTRIAREDDPAIAVVIMTGHNSLDTLHATVRRGVADYLTKPFEVDELTVVVEQALHKRRLLQESLRLRALEQLLRSSEAINAILDREQLAAEIVRCARDLVPSTAGFLILAPANAAPTRVICAPEDALLMAGGLDAVAQSLRAGRAIAVVGAAALGALGERMLHGGLAAPLRAQGEALGALLLCDDRSDLASAGAQEILALLAHQAGNALHNAHLYSELDAAFKELRELDRLKSEFIAIASHELRSPLAIVMGYAKMTRDHTEGDPREYAQRVLDSAERIKGIVDDMMRLRDFDTRQSEVVLEWAALEQLVLTAIERLHPVAEQKGQQITTGLPAGTIALNIDREKALLVIGNLVANAIKFTPEGGSINIETSRWPKQQLTEALAKAPANPTVRRLSSALPDEWAVVQVQDNGIGIPREQQQRIFERFFQVANSLTRDHGGAGLGLAIVCDLATLQGGVVWVESEEGRGSVFSFALPIS